MTFPAGTIGYAPRVLVQPFVMNPEKLKYDKLWQNPDYRKYSPGEQWAMQFLEVARPERDAEAIDFGCGTGRGALMLALMGAMKVTMVDFSQKCLDEEVAQACVTQPTRLNFKMQDLSNPLAVNAAYGYCCDVMEHIPTADVQIVLKNILAAAQHVFFGISTVDDEFGKTIGETLHLTVKPMDWWVDQIKKAGAVVHWTQEQGGACAIYCSGWKDAGEVVDEAVVNVDLSELEEQTRLNIMAGYVQVRPHENQDRDIILLAGGPSMNEFVDEIKQYRKDGCALVTVNGAYQWAIDHGMDPSVQIVLDGRKFNKRFVETPHPTCRYLIASQAHPDTLQAVPKDRTLLWHSGISDENEKLVRDLYGEYYPTPGGSTVVLRALPLMRMLGCKRFHVYGFDSCVMKEEGKSDDEVVHHAYPQAENNSQPTLPVVCGGRTFWCTPWMLSQASEFRDVVACMGDEMELDIRGDGLIAWMVKTGADFSTTDPQAKD